MKLICSKSHLLAGVQTVSKAVPSKTTMSILECILLNTNNGIITLTANDMELGIETVIEGTILESYDQNKFKVKIDGQTLDVEADFIKSRVRKA